MKRQIAKICEKLNYLTRLQLIPLLKTRGKLRVFKNAEINIPPTSKIDIVGSLQFNLKWEKNTPYPSILSMGKNSRLIVCGDFRIYSGSRVYITPGASLLLGSGYINTNMTLSCFERIEIGNGVSISENVIIRDSDTNDFITSSSSNTQPIKIGNQVCIGMNVTILKGVTIGDCCIISAGSVVDNDLPSNCLAGGVPAKIIRQNLDIKNCR